MAGFHNYSCFDLECRVECFLNLTKINASVKKYSRPVSEQFVYQPEGICCNELQLPYIAFRLAIVAALKSQSERGIMTGMLFSCYEPQQHIVVTLYTCRGEPLHDEWQRMANQMLNYSDHELIVQLGHSSAKGPEMGPPPNVIVARESTGISKSAGNAAIAAIQSMSGCYRLVVEITGAQLRYLLNHSRLQSVYFADKSINESKYLNDLRDLCKLLFEQTPKSQQNYERTISVDFANGINSLKFRKLVSCVKDHLRLEIFNRSQALKKPKAGSGYVFAYQSAPDKMCLFPGDKCVAMNYEGSKLVYFYRPNDDSAVRALDGSRLAALFSLYFKHLLCKFDAMVRIAVIMSAGCNSGACDYIRSRLGLQVQLVQMDRGELLKEATRHRIALMFDEEGFAMLYMEAPYVRKVYRAAQKGCNLSKRLWALYVTLGLAKGDALITLIVTESILRYYDLSLEDWERMYVQRVQLRLEVLTKPDQLDRLFDNRFAINWRRQIESEIDLVQARFNQARVVVRPCSRKRRIKVMIESLQEYEAKQLAFLVVQILNENLN